VGVGKNILDLEGGIRGKGNGLGRRPEEKKSTFSFLSTRSTPGIARGAYNKRATVKMNMR